MTGFPFRAPSVEEGVEVRIVSGSAEEVREVGDLLADFLRSSLCPEEFFDSGTVCSTHPRYRGSYIRRIRIKIPQKRL